jgi:diguanylate cyclase (GGDEF)-like protein
MSYTETGARVPGRGGALFHSAMLALAVAVIAVVEPAVSWDAGSLLVITAFTLLSGFAYSDTDSAIQIQGTPLGLMLAAVLLGAAPAACLGALTVCVMQLRLRSPRHVFTNNLVTFVWFPLIGALIFHGLVALFGVQRSDLGFDVVVIPAFLGALTINFVGVAGYRCWLERGSLMRMVQEMLIPVMPAELVASLLTVGAVWISERTGAMGIALLGVVLLVYQSLVGELLKSQSRATELTRMATTDGLTGLANRGAFAAHVASAIAAHPTGPGFSLSLIDIDRFKEINDTLGHHCGDELLCEIARRLEGCVSPHGVVARLGGDEFVVMMADTTDSPDVVLAVAEQLADSVSEPYDVDEMAISVGASIGIARFPRDGDDLNELMRRADIAMYAAKEAQTGCKLFAPELDHHSVRRLSLMGDVTRALGAREIVVHYQPIISAEDFALQGAESLVRWQHREHGLLLPGSFIESVERTPMVHPLTMLVLERSIEQCTQWRRSGQDLFVAVNLSVRNLLNPGLPGEIAALLKRYGLDPSALKLEITESAIMIDPDLVTATILKLNALGVRLSVDDFGTGFSSLNYLRNLPIDELKIDRSFVSPMLTSESDFIIVRSTINLAHDLGLNVVAEGVEDALTLTELSRLGCDLVQGFHVSRPLPADAFGAWMPGPPSAPRQRITRGIDHARTVTNH